MSGGAIAATVVAAALLYVALAIAVARRLLRMKRSEGDNTWYHAYTAEVMSTGPRESKKSEVGTWLIIVGFGFPPAGLIYFIYMLWSWQARRGSKSHVG